MPTAVLETTTLAIDLNPRRPVGGGTMLLGDPTVAGYADPFPKPGRRARRHG
jgi:hypothetical protein